MIEAVEVIVMSPSLSSCQFNVRVRPNVSSLPRLGGEGSWLYPAYSVTFDLAIRLFEFLRDIFQMHPERWLGTGTYHTVMLHSPNGHWLTVLSKDSPNQWLIQTPQGVFDGRNVLSARGSGQASLAATYRAMVGDIPRTSP